MYAIASECFGVPVEELAPTATPFNTGGWDSMAHLTFITRIEQAFGITLTPLDILDLGSLEDAEVIVARHAGRPDRA